MKINITVLLFMLYSFASISQIAPTRYVDYGLLRIQGNLAMGFPSSNKGTNMYWVGDLDYYLRDNISISSGFYYFFGSFNNDKLLKHNHSAYLGASYHFKTKGHFDPFIGFLPGYSINQANAGSVRYDDSLSARTSFPVAVNPLFSVTGGFNYYANRFFNVFVKAQYQVGKHYSDVAPISLNELKLSFGLGYMLWARKKYFRFRKPNDVSQ
jgi:hypothetical protein